MHYRGPPRLRILPYVNMDDAVSRRRLYKLCCTGGVKDKVILYRPIYYSFCGLQTRELKMKSKRTLAGFKRIFKMARNNPTMDAIESCSRLAKTLQNYYTYYYQSHIKHLLKLEACKFYSLHLITKITVWKIKLNTSCTYFAQICTLSYNDDND